MNMDGKVVSLEVFLKALASEKKLNLIIHLYSCICGKCNVNFLVAQQMATQSNISKHLMSLRRSGIVSFSKENRNRHYEIAPFVRQTYSHLLDSILEINDYRDLYCQCALAQD